MTEMGLAVRVTTGGWLGGGGGGLPPKCRTRPVEARRLFCLLSLLSVNLVMRYSAWNRRKPMCLLKFTSTPPPRAVANELAENDLLKNAEGLGVVETWMSDSVAPPKRACTKGVQCWLRWENCGPNKYV